jgi:peptidyl-prolyl cis-trans isomerase SurA
MRIYFRILMAGALLLSGAPAQAALANYIQAIVSDAVITYQQVQMFAAQAVDVLHRQYGNQPDIFEKKYLETLNNALEQLVERQLILHDFKTAGYNLPEPFIEENIQGRIRSRYGDRATLVKSLQADGITWEKFRQQIREQIIIEALRAKHISQEIIMSPHKIEAYYADHRDDYKMEDQVKLRMIALDSTVAETAEGRRKLAQEILGKIKDGAAFSEMATVYSTGSQRSQGGDWGWVERSVLRKELADVAFSLKPGSLSDVIETEKECYLMLVEENRLSHVRPLSELRDEIERTLLMEERTRLQKQWIDRLKAKTFVRYF